MALFSRLLRRATPAHVLALLCLAGFSLTAAANPAAGSWQAVLGDLDLRVPGRIKLLPPLKPPALAHGRTLTRVSWQFSQQPRRAGYQAWICHPDRCFALPTLRGSSRALAGLDAGQPLRVGFRLPAGAPPFTVQSLQLQVEYR
jgi:flagellar protein FlhE